MNTLNITEEQINYLRKQHLQISVPCYGGMLFASCATSLMQTLLYAQKIGMQISFNTLTNESLIPRGRCHLSAMFLENSAATHLMFIDSDIGFKPENVFSMLLKDKEIIAGCYSKKNLPVDLVLCVSKENVNEDGSVKLVDGLMPCTRVGTGFLMIKRQVFDKLKVAYPDASFKNNIGLDPKFDPHCWNFFASTIAPDNRELLSEDYYFCLIARAIGIEVFADPTILLDHSGTFVFPGNPIPLYQQMGIADFDKNPQLRPHVAIRADELDDPATMLSVGPDMEALNKYLQDKAAGKKK